MATTLFYRLGLACAIITFGLMFIAFTSPYWYKSWTRVHSPFANIGLWHICLSGFIIPRDPIMKSYVGCWWIHSNEFLVVANNIMPPWFRFIQLFCVLITVIDLLVVFFLIFYLIDDVRRKLYANTGRMFIINGILLLISAFLVFLIAIVFAEMSLSPDYFPRPWMNYLSWSYGCCVLSGFFAAFGGMILFILGLIYKDKELHEADQLDSAAELRKQQMSPKQEEMMREKPPPSQYIPPSRYAPPEKGYYAPQAPPIAKKPPPVEPRVGESFV